MRIASVPCAVAATALPAACGSGRQELSVRTDPAGALVSLQRMGERTVSGTIAGVGGGSVDGGSFTEDWIVLGNAPVEYEFERVDREGGGRMAGSGGEVTKRYREGMVRAELEGYRTVERRVRFDGDPVELVLTLQRAGATP